MTSFLKPHSELGYVRDTTELQKVLNNGDGISWPGDPNLSIHQGVLKDPKGKIVARRWEVWRACEDGKSRIIGHWRMEEYDRIVWDLTRMRLDSPGHVDTVAAIEKQNDEKEARESAKLRDKMGEMHDHFIRLVVDRSGPKNHFEQVGKALPDTSSEADTSLAQGSTDAR